MTTSPSPGPGAGEPTDSMLFAASAWAVRRDRGLGPEELEAFERWLGEDARHAAAWERSSSMWGGLLGRPFAPAALPAARAPGWRPWAFAGLAAGGLALGYAGWRAAPRGPSAAPARAAERPAEPRVLVLADGTVVYVDAGSEVAERYSPGERRLLLLHGQAHFEVAKDDAWPFVVRAGPVEVRAVGTAFNVDLQPGGVEVRVTEGRVRLAPTSAPAGAESPLLHAGQKAVLESAASAPAVFRISEMDPQEIARNGAWRDPLVRLGGGKTLAQFATEFTQRTGRRLTLADAELREIKVGGQIRADDLEGFIWMMESYGLKAEQSADGGLTLRKSR